MTVTTILPQDTPRSLEVLLESAQADAGCSHCGALAGQPCRWQGVRGVHLQRFIGLLVSGLMTVPEMAVVLGGLDVFTAATLIRPGAPGPDSPVRIAFRLGFQAGLRRGRGDR